MQCILHYNSISLVFLSDKNPEATSSHTNSPNRWQGEGKQIFNCVVLSWRWAHKYFTTIYYINVYFMFWTCAHFQIQGKITGPKTRTTDKTFGITVEAFEDKVNLDKAIQCPKDLWECPTQAILVGVVKDTAQEEPIIPEPGVEETTQVPDNPAQHFDNNLPS